MRQKDSLSRTLLGCRQERLFWLGGSVKNLGYHVLVESECSRRQDETGATANAQRAIDGSFNLMRLRHQPF
jgi:hypothetical protein